MKILPKFILFIFITFLSTPTIIAVIEKHYDISMFYSFAEEEVEKELNEKKIEIKYCKDFHFFLILIKNDSKIFSENLSKHDNVSEEIFSPPPELV